MRVTEQASTLDEWQSSQTIYLFILRYLYMPPTSGKKVSKQFMVTSVAGAASPKPPL